MHVQLCLQDSSRMWSHLGALPCPIVLLLRCCVLRCAPSVMLCCACMQAPKLAISPDERVQIPVLSDLNANK